MLKPSFLVLAGDGINCERETRDAFEQAGASGEIIHVNDLLRRPSILNEFSGLALPGGFSLGDELGSGRIMALKLRYGMGGELDKFISAKKPIIGICNGFQILAQMGLLPYLTGGQSMALATNSKGCFMNRWVKIKTEKTVCKWTALLPESLELPIRHKEGRVVLSRDSKRDIYGELLEKGQIVFRYEEDVNGSFQNIAGVCDGEGLILGMMPHPEAFTFSATARTIRENPLERGVGLLLFESIVKYLRERV
ncbi:MAG: phosphoribosylformylglycinamidine synthase subunit PurQ [Halobacteriovoraceae bacterium]|nr:phosphoribosylformylglycinamidine synthase subunit PurQ [Halobacteriovoraceae bacterium]